MKQIPYIAIIALILAIIALLSSILLWLSMPPPQRNLPTQFTNAEKKEHLRLLKKHGIDREMVWTENGVTYFMRNGKRCKLR